MEPIQVDEETVFNRVKEFPQGEVLIEYFKKYVKREEATLKPSNELFNPNAHLYSVKGKAKESGLETRLVVSPLYSYGAGAELTHDEDECYLSLVQGKLELKLDSRLEKFEFKSLSEKDQPKRIPVNLLKEGVKMYEQCLAIKEGLPEKKE